MVEQEIALAIAQHLMQRRPRRRSIERRVEQRLDPGREQIFRRAIPGVVQGPDASPRRAGRRGLVGMHGDVARDGAAAGSRQRRMPRAGGRRRHFGEPEIRRPAVPRARFGSYAAVGRDQRKLAFERLFGGKDDAQRRALPRRDRRRQNRDPGCVCAGATLGLGAHDREKQAAKRAGDRQRCRHGSSKLASWKQWNPLALLVRN